MKILFTTFNKENQGSFLRAMALAKELAKRGHAVSVLCASRENQFEEKQIDSVKLLTFPWGKRFLHGYNLCEVQARNAWLGNQKFDVVHAFDMRPTCAKPAFKAKRNGAVMFTDWADWFGKGGSVEERASFMARTFLRPVESYGERHLRKKADGTTTICSHLYKMGKNLGISEDRLLLLYNGFDQKISPRTDKLEARKALNLDPDLRIIGTLGAFFTKDFELLTEASHCCQTLRSTKFIHIGQGNPILDGSDIHLSGRVTDQELSLYLQACDLLLLPMANIPANHGRFPLKFSEYISAGRPVLATNVGDVPKFIEEHACGYICNPNPKDLGDALVEALANPETMLQYGKNAHNLSQNERFSWHKRSLDLEAFYMRLLDKKN